MLSNFSRSPSSIRSTGTPVQRLTTDGDVLVGDFLAQHRALGRDRGVGELLLELGDAAVLKLAGAGEIAAALGLLEFDPGGVELGLEFGLGADLFLFRLPAAGQFGRVLFEIGELAFERGEAVLGGRCRSPSSAPRARS